MKDSGGKRKREALRPARRFPAFIAPATWFGLGLLAALPAALLLPLLGGPAPAAPVGPPPSPDVLAAVESSCRQADELSAQERHSEAFEKLKEAARLDPRNPRPLIGLGMVSRNLGYSGMAGDFFRKAVELDPTNWAAKGCLSLVLSDLGMNRESIALLEDVERERPNDPLLLADLATNDLRLGNFRDAIPVLEKYNAVMGRQAWGYENLGRAFAGAGDIEKAERAYRSAIEIDPKTPLAHLWLGELLVRSDRKAEAEKCLQTFRELRTLQTQAHFLEVGVGQNPSDVDALIRLAFVRRLLGQYAAALVPLERAMKLMPDDDRLRNLHASLKKMAEGAR